MVLKFFFLLIFFIHTAHAYELVMIQAIGEETFITRLGKRQGIIPGFVGTFTAKNVSFLAKAQEVIGEFTQWKIMNTQLTFPFKKGDVVTYYPATEYLWVTSPESERRKFIKSRLSQKRKSFILKGSFSRGLNESTSSVLANSTRRGGYLGEVYYEKSFWKNFHYDLGLRYDQEVANYSGFSFETQRLLLVANLVYYMNSLENLIPQGQLFLGGGLGYGFSLTSSTTLTQSGYAALLPNLRAGISLPFNVKWNFLIETALETLSTREKQESGFIQTTSQTNVKFGFGLKRFLN